MNQPQENTNHVQPRIYEHDYVAMRKCKHGVFLYNTHDLFISKSLDSYGEWCEGEIDVLSQLIKPGDVVIDVGANIGTHTVFFSKQVTNQGCVFAFEPQRIIFQNLCANLSLNALVNVIAKQQGIGKQKGTILLPIFEPHRDYNFGAINILGHSQGEMVEITTIDDLHLRRCNLIKVDVEGMECDVLEGAKDTISKYRPVLFVENNELDSSTAIISMIDSLDYVSYWHICGYFNPNNFFHNTDNLFKTYRPEANLLCFHRSCKLNIKGLQKVSGIDDNWQKILKRLAINPYFSQPL